MEKHILKYNGEEVDHLLAKIEQAPDVIASEAYVQTEVANLVNSAPETLDTLGEVAKAIEDNETVVEALNAAIGNKADKTELANKADISYVDSKTGTVVKKYVFTSSGTHTIEPGFYYVEMCGGGGGGTRNSTGSSQYSGSSGAMAAFFCQISNSLTVTVGAGGTAGKSGSDFEGGNGGDTYISADNSVIAGGGPGYDGKGTQVGKVTASKPVIAVDGVASGTSSPVGHGFLYNGTYYGQGGKGGSSSTTAGTKGIVILTRVAI